jgi:hypothetical protein
VTNLYLSSSATIPSWTSSSFTSPINTVETRGYSASNQASLKISASLAGPTSAIGPTVTYTGFPQTGPLQNPGNKIANNITIKTNMPTDSYSSDPQKGFYLQVDTQVEITNAITASNQEYTVTLSQIQAPSTTSVTSTFPFYYDTLSGVPTITTTQHSFKDDISTKAVQISGIWVLQGSIPLTVVTTASNMGQYFYPTGNILLYSTGHNENNLTNLPTGSITNGKINNPITFTNNSITHTNNSYATTIPFSTTAYNLLGSSSKSATSISAILDYPSYNLIKNLLAQSIPNITTSQTTGFRVYSGVATASFVPLYLFNSTTPYSSVPYLQSWSLIVANNSGGYDGTQELMVANGAFQTTNSNYNTDYTSYLYGNETASKNTFNYTTMISSTNTTTRYRYATFVWKISPITTEAYNNINIVINNLTNVKSKNQVLYCDDESTIIKIYYRIEDSNNLGTETDVSLLGSKASTNWLSVNEAASTTLTKTTSEYNKKSNTVFYSPPSIVNQNGGAFSIVVPHIYTLNSSKAPTELKIYVRIGFPMTVTGTGPTMGPVEAYLS